MQPMEGPSCCMLMVIMLMTESQMKKTRYSLENLAVNAKAVQSSKFEIHGVRVFSV